MSNVKERIIGAVTIMSEEEAEKVWNLIQASFILSDVATFICVLSFLLSIIAEKNHIANPTLKHPPRMNIPSMCGGY